MRAVYDKYGQFGIDMFGQFGDSVGIFLSPEGNSILVTLFCLFSFLIALFSIFPIFLALRGDQSVMWSWAVVFIPVWILDFFVYAFIYGRYFRNISEDDGEEELEEDGKIF